LIFFSFLLVWLFGFARFNWSLLHIYFYKNHAAITVMTIIIKETNYYLNLKAGCKGPSPGTKKAAPDEKIR